MWTFVILCIALLLIGGAAVLARLGIQMWSRDRLHIAIPAIFLAAVLGASGALGLKIFGDAWTDSETGANEPFSGEQENRAAPIAGNIFVSCQLTFMPTVMPQEGRLEIVALAPDAMKNTAGKVLVTNRTGAPGSKINWPEGFFGNAPQGWRCEITNDSQTPLLDVRVPVHVKYGKQGEEREGVYQLVSTRLDPDPSNRRVIYLYNRSPEGGSMQILSPAAAVKLSEKTHRQIEVSQPIEWISRLIFLMPLIQPSESKDTSP